MMLFSGKYIRIFNGYEERIENSITRVSRGLLSGAEGLSPGTEFSIHTKQPSWFLFLEYSFFSACI